SWWPSAHCDRAARTQVWTGLGGGETTLPGASRFEVDSMAGNQRAYWVADHDAGSISAGAAAAGWIRWRIAARANSFALPGCGGRAGSALFGPEATDTNGVRAAGFANGAQAWRTPVVRGGALDYLSGVR